MIVELSVIAESVLISTRQALQEAVEQWQRDWDARVDISPVSCERAWISDSKAAEAGQRFISLVGDDGRWTGLTLSPGFGKRLHPLRDGPLETTGIGGGGSGIGGELVDAAMSALFSSQEVLSGSHVIRDAANGVAPARHKAELERARRHASGYIAAHVSFGRETLSLLLNPAAVGYVAGRQTEGDDSKLHVVDLNRALDRTPVSMRVLLGETTLGIGSLATLSVGDVIPLAQLVDKPLPLVDAATNEPLMRGYLGVVEQHLAIRLAAN